MIKLKPLIKEDCGCGCGGCETKLNESLQLPNGNKSKWVESLLVKEKLL